jgi:hypothetical protein
MIFTSPLHLQSITLAFLLVYIHKTMILYLYPHDSPYLVVGDWSCSSLDDLYV